MASTLGSGAELRQLARRFLSDLARHEFIPESQHEDWAGSLVRQWITCDGKAVLLLGERLTYLLLGRTPLGRLRVTATGEDMGWDRLIDDWKIDRDQLQEASAQLNVAQSAVLTNADGLSIRLWIDAKKHGHGVEALGKQAAPPSPIKRNYRKIAADGLHGQFGATLAPDEMEALTNSVAAQWQRYRGRACIFTGVHQRLVFILTEIANGGCDMEVRREGINLGPLFDSVGFAPAAIPRAIARLNLGEPVEFRDRNGFAAVMRHDPTTLRIEVRRVSPPSAAPPQAP